MSTNAQCVQKNMKTTRTYTRFQCDRCPSQVDEYHGHNPDGWKDYYDYKSTTKFDFCPRCVDSFNRWLHGVPKPDRESPSAADIKLESAYRALETLAAKGGQGTSFDVGWQGALTAIRQVLEECDRKEEAIHNTTHSCDIRA